MLVILLPLPAFLFLLIVSAATDRLITEEITIHSTARDFYHGLGTKNQQILLHSADLQVEENVRALRRLLSDPSHAIATIYNNGCNLIGEERAGRILQVIGRDKELEQLLLGPACLSDIIFKARVSISGMWPPTNIPLLVKGLSMKGWAKTVLTGFLIEALKKPQWWYSTDWVWDVDWSAFDNASDTDFWKLIPTDYGFISHKGHHSYMRRSLRRMSSFERPQDLEELLMKIVQLLAIEYPWTKLETEKSFLCGKRAFLQNFIHLNRDNKWCAEAFRVLNQLCINGLKGQVLSDAIVGSDLLRVDFWQEAVDKEIVDKATAINAMFDLFTVTVRFRRSEEEKDLLRELLKSLFNNLDDLSLVIPVKLKALLKIVILNLGRESFEGHVESFVSDDRLLVALSELLSKECSSLRVIKYSIKMRTKPLIDLFMEGEHNDTKVNKIGEWNIYARELYKAWYPTGSDLVLLHMHISSSYPSLLTSSLNEPDSWEPDLDHFYYPHNWRLLFASVVFEIVHDIPRKIILSKCFLKALVYFHRRVWQERGILQWAELREAIGAGCILPMEAHNQNRYQLILDIAHEEFFRKSLDFPLIDAETLQALIAGGNQMMTTPLDESTRNISRSPQI